MKILSLVFLTLLFTAQSLSASGLEIDIQQYKLKNGLEVILSRSENTPFVAVDIWYHVGASVETSGKTGFAHLFEHLMFQGTPNTGEDMHFKRLEAAGATSINGSTSFDRTNYYEVVPANEIELALWLESDRMGWLMNGISPEKLENQRSVVKNERRQRFDNQPYGQATEKSWQALFPQGHPYHGNVIGSMQDLDNASLSDVRQFFEKYYAPSNATLVVSGNFNQTTIKSKIDKYFSSLKKASKPSPVKLTTPPLKQEIILKEIEPLGRIPLLQIQYLTPAFYEPGDADLDLLAYLLTGKKSSLLTKPLMFDKQIVQNISAQQQSTGNVSVFSITALVPEIKNIELVKKTIDDTIKKLTHKNPDIAELNEARNFIKTSTLFDMQSELKVAESLQGYNHFLGDPNSFSADFERYEKVTPKSISAAAKAYLKPTSRVILYATPSSLQGN